MRELQQRSCHLYWLALTLMMILMFPSYVQGQSKVKPLAVDRTVDLIVTIEWQFEKTPMLGAGIIFARERDRIYIATANHVVRYGEREATNLKIRLKTSPKVILKARLLPQADASSDLAVLIVDDVTNIDTCGIPLDALAPPQAFKRGQNVYPVGNPNGKPWIVPVIPDVIAEVRDHSVIFQSTILTSGHSGGALLDTDGGLVGLIQEDEPPFGRALDVRELIRILNQWNFPVHLRAPNLKGWTSLFSAILRNDIQDVKHLLEESCTDVNAIDDGEGGVTPLHIASRKSVDLVKNLIDAGARTRAQDKYGEEPLHYALRNRNLDSARLLLAKGASMTARGILEIVANEGYIDMVKEILTLGGDPNNAIPYQINESTEEILRLAIKFGANINNKGGDDRDTLLTLAIENKCIGCVRILLDAGANIYVRNRNKKSPIELATQYFYPNKEIVFLLLERISSIDAQEADRLISMLDSDWGNVLRKLAKLDLIRHSGSSYSALIKAARYGHVEIVRLLLDAGVDPGTTEEWSISRGGWNVPLNAVLSKSMNGEQTPDAKSRLEIVKLLIAKGAAINLNATVPHYMLPLYKALFELDPPDLEVAKVLISYGANVDAISYYDRSSSILDYAEKSQKLTGEMLQLLRKHSSNR